MKRLRFPLVVALSASLVLGLSGPALANDDFRFQGSGWGHGIGMSQYGALGQALEGRDYKRILSHYYADTSVGTYNLSYPILVGVLQNRNAVRLVSRGGSSTIKFAGNPHTAKAGETWKLAVTSDGSRCRLTGPGTDLGGSCELRAIPGSGARVEVVERGLEYKRGQVRVRPKQHPSTGSFLGQFHVTVQVPMEHYLLALAEMPYWWGGKAMDALRVQAVAGRSYATHRALSLGNDVSKSRYRQRDCWCHVYDSVWDQVYDGWRPETYSSWPYWRDAVTGTRYEVVRAPGATGTQDGVVQAFYSSSSGGRTEHKHEVWGGSTYPYLVSRDDSWAKRTNPDGMTNPYRHWSAAIPASTVAKKVGLDSVSRVEVVARYTSGSASKVVFRGTKNGSAAEVTRTGGQVRNLFGCGEFPKESCVRSAYIDQIFLPPFVDDDGSKFEADIVWIADQGITKGCNPPANDRYCPEEPVLRKQMAAFMVRALGLTQTSSGGNFKDVPSGSTFAKDINKLATAGITKGCNPPANDRFCPEEPVLRKQMAAFIVRAQKLTKTSSGGNFKDVPSGSTFAEDINKLATAGITKGCNPPANDRFCPDEAVSRAQMAAFLRRGAPW